MLLKMNSIKNKKIINWLYNLSLKLIKEWLFYKKR